MEVIGGADNDSIDVFAAKNVVDTSRRNRRLAREFLNFLLRLLTFLPSGIAHRR